MMGRRIQADLSVDKGGRVIMRPPWDFKSSTLYSTLLYSTLHYSTLLYSTLLYSTLYFMTLTVRMVMTSAGKELGAIYFE